MSEAAKLVNKVPEKLGGAKDASTKDHSDTEKAEETTTQARQQVTFMGNSYDIAGLGAFAGGILVLASCLTCGQAIYCLPILPLILGVIGLVMAKEAVDEDRTRLWSWLGIGGAGIGLLLLIFAILSYFAFIAFIVAVSRY